MDLFKNGIIYILGTLLVVIVDGVIKALTDDFKTAGTIAFKRLKKYGIASLLVVIIYMFIVYFVLNSNFKIPITTEDSLQLLFIFIDTFCLFYINAIISTFVMKLLERYPKIVEWVKPNHIECSRSIIMTVLIILMLAIFSIVNKAISFEKNYVVNDVAVLYNESNYTLPKDSPFEFEYTDNKCGNKKSEYRYVTQNAEYKVMKETKLKLKRGTVLKLSEEKDEGIDFYNGDQVANAVIKTTKNSAVILEKDIDVVLQDDVVVNLNQTNEYFNLFFINFAILEFSLVIYYVLNTQLKKDAS
ncbi:hypothetical protein [Streptococcus salivarius]